MRRERDAGFTLTELLVVIVILGAISGGLLSVVATFLRTQGGATTQFDDSRSLQQVATYFPRDVAASIPASLSSNPSDTSPCPGSGGGPNVLSMNWNEIFGNGTPIKTYHASYRLQTSGSTTWLVRVTCEGPTWAQTKVVRLTNRLAASPTKVSADVNGGYVVMVVHTNTGRQLQLAATSSSPTEGLDYDDELD